MKLSEVKRKPHTGGSFGTVILLCVSLLSVSAAGGCGDNQPVSEAPGVTTISRSAAKPGQRETITVGLPGLPEGATKLEMVLVEPGTFTMSSPKYDSNNPDTGWPPHTVTISKPFHIGRYEVTQAQWEVVMGEGSHHSKYRPQPDNPVEKVSWFNCQLFLRKLNKLGMGTFRLPTEAEWEYACRAGTNTLYSFGDGPENAGDFMWWSGNNNPDGTKKVGSKQPNAWGLYDMHGNVCEWCSEKWVRPFKRTSYTDPQRAPSPLTYMLLLRRRIFKGGGFGYVADECRTASRFYEQSIDFHFTIGLRLVRECD